MKTLDRIVEILGSHCVAITFMKLNQSGNWLLNATPSLTRFVYFGVTEDFEAKPLFVRHDGKDK